MSNSAVIPSSLTGWLKFIVAVVAVLFIVNNVSFLTNLVNRRISA